MNLDIDGYPVVTRPLFSTYSHLLIMSRKTLTFKVADVKRAIETNPTKFLTLSLQKSKKDYACTYLDATIQVGNTTSAGLWISGGGRKDQPNSGGFVLGANVLDLEKAKEKYTENPEGQRSKITTMLSKSGDLGVVSMAMNDLFKTQVENLANSGVINIKNRSICLFAQTNISDDCKDPALRGKAIDDPILRITVDFSAPKEWYRKGYAWGKNVTQFLDYNKPFTVTDANGVTSTKYEELLWTNEEGVDEPITSENMHHVLTAGSIVHEYTIWYGNTSISKSYVSSKATITRCVIECIDNSIEVIAEPDFGDEVKTATVISASEITNANTNNTNNSAQLIVADQAVQAADPVATDDAIGDLLGSF